MTASMTAATTTTAAARDSDRGHQDNCQDDKKPVHSTLPCVLQALHASLVSRLNKKHPVAPSPARVTNT
jgi:hypothetical protein